MKGNCRVEPTDMMRDMSGAFSDGAYLPHAAATEWEVTPC